MKWKRIIVGCILPLLAAEIVNAQNHTGIPLKRGNGNPIIETDSLVIISVDLSVPSQPETDLSSPLRLKLKTIPPTRRI